MKNKNPLASVIGINLRRERLARELSQEALGHMARIHRTYIGSVEHGRRNISSENIERLAMALDIKETVLVKRDKKIKKEAVR